MAKKTKTKAFVSREEGAKLRLTRKAGEVVKQPQMAVAASPDQMIMIALQSGRSMDEIGKLIELRNNEIARVAELEYNKAMATFKTLIAPVTKNRNASFDHKAKEGREPGKTSYNFSDLAAIEVAIKQHCGTCGVTYDWKTRYEGDYIYIRCIVRHVDGHTESDELRGRADKSGGKNDIQADNSTVTYLRRYSLMGVLGLSTEDNDGKKAPRNDAHYDKFVNVDQDTVFLVKPTASEYGHLMRSVMEGKTTVNEILTQFSLTEDQINALNISKRQSKTGI